jgi:hypothetical protein
VNPKGKNGESKGKKGESKGEKVESKRGVNPLAR